MELNGALAPLQSSAREEVNTMRIFVVIVGLAMTACMVIQSEPPTPGSAAKTDRV